LFCQICRGSGHGEDPRTSTRSLRGSQAGAKGPPEGRGDLTSWETVKRERGSQRERGWGRRDRPGNHGRDRRGADGICEGSTGGIRRGGEGDGSGRSWERDASGGLGSWGGKWGRGSSTAGPDGTGPHGGNQGHWGVGARDRVSRGPGTGDHRACGVAGQGVGGKGVGDCPASPPLGLPKQFPRDESTQFRNLIIIIAFFLLLFLVLSLNRGVGNAAGALDQGKGARAGEA
jgi:hypothetical protein